MGEEVSRTMGPGHTGSPGTCSEKPLDKGMAQSDYHFEKLPMALEERANQERLQD